MPVRTIKQQEEGRLGSRVFTEQQKDFGLLGLTEEEEVSMSEEEFDELVKC